MLTHSSKQTSRHVEMADRTTVTLNTGKRFHFLMVDDRKASVNDKRYSLNVEIVPFKSLPPPKKNQQKTNLD